MKKLVKEELGDVLRGKSSEELGEVFPPEAQELVDAAYESIAHNKDFRIITDLGYFSAGMETGYGFQFEGVYPIEDEDQNPTLSYHIGEYPEYTLGYFPVDEEIEIIFENNGFSRIIKSLEDFYQFIGLEEDQFEQPQGVFEDLKDIIKPKSEEYLRAHFEKEHPEFVKIFKGLFPNEQYTLQPDSEGIEANFMFTEGDHMFIVSQNKFHKYPNIFYLDREAGGEQFAGMFKDQQPVKSVKDVREYVRRKTQ